MVFFFSNASSWFAHKEATKPRLNSGRREKLGNVLAQVELITLWEDLPFQQGTRSVHGTRVQQFVQLLATDSAVCRLIDVSIRLRPQHVTGSEGSGGQWSVKRQVGFSTQA